MNQQKIELFRKYLDGRCSTEELEQVLESFRDGMVAARDEAEWLAILTADAIQIQENQLEASVTAAERINLYERIHQSIQKRREDTAADVKKTHVGLRWVRYTAAAALLVFSVIGGWYYWDSSLKSDIDRGTHRTSLLTSEIVTPGGNRASLRISDGRTIELSPNQAGIITGEELVYFDGSKIAELKELNTDEVPLEYYMLSTPNGGTYQVELPDGTKVWLNASSVLRYPSRFEDGSRVVELAGEAYFEVVPSDQSANRPFFVKTRNQTVEVLGTSFNVSAYSDESTVTTTLITGVIQINVPELNKVAVLDPGTQSILTAGTLDVKRVDVTPFIAWKEGRFAFGGQDLKDVLRTISRWYDVEIVYEYDPVGLRIGGGISRFQNIGEVLELIQETGDVRFNLIGRRVIVMK